MFSTPSINRSMQEFKKKFCLASSCVIYSSLLSATFDGAVFTCVRLASDLIMSFWGFIMGSAVKTIGVMYGYGMHSID